MVDYLRMHRSFHSFTLAVTAYTYNSTIESKAKKRRIRIVKTADFLIGQRNPNVRRMHGPCAETHYKCSIRRHIHLRYFNFQVVVTSYYELDIKLSSCNTRFGHSNQSSHSAPRESQIDSIKKRPPSPKIHNRRYK